jgi:hypothetical protein
LCPCRVSSPASLRVDLVVPEMLLGKLLTPLATRRACHLFAQLKRPCTTTAGPKTAMCVLLICEP